MSDPAPAPRAPRFAREITAAVLSPLAIWVIGWAHPYVYDGTIALIALLAAYEFLDLGKRKGNHLPLVLCLAVMLFIIIAFVLGRFPIEVAVYAALLIIPGWFVLSRGNLEEALPSSGIAVLVTLYIGMLAGALIRLHNDFPVGWKLIFFLLLVVWLGDAGAYYVGKQFGRHKMSPRISPKKTVEGGIGGVTTSIVTALVIHFTFFKEFPLVHVIVAGVLLSIAGMIGDLAESMWKRSAAVKDSGTLIPGHGGFLDRFDSILYTAPLLYGYWALIKPA